MLTIFVHSVCVCVAFFEKNRETKQMKNQFYYQPTNKRINNETLDDNKSKL